MNFINKLSKFIYSRYGIDDLYKFLFKLYILVLILNIFIRNYIVFIIELLLIFIIFYRACSKNIYRRRKENEIYLKIKNKFLKPFRSIKRNFNDKDHIYKKCKSCKTVLKLPLPDSKGIKHAKCPKCNKKLTIFTVRKQKIEIIRNKKQF